MSEVRSIQADLNKVQAKISRHPPPDVSPPLSMAAKEPSMVSVGPVELERLARCQLLLKRYEPGNRR